MVGWPITKQVGIVQSEKDPYEVPKSIGIFRLLESPKDITTTSVAQRIMANHDAYVVISFCPLFGFRYGSLISSYVKLFETLHN